MRSLSVFLFVLFLNVPLFGQEPPTKLPDFEFMKYDSSTFSQKQLNPKKQTLIIFFDATCGHCQEAMKKVNTRYDELKQLNLLLISMDVEKSVKMFLTAYGPKMLNNDKVTVLMDSKYEFVPLFHPKQYPSLYLYGKNKELLMYANNDEKINDLFNLIAKNQK